ncbi:hypothetical protein DH2020_043224 [Rehmannia glutinosa]|uniref:HXXXD-type acyl-transferase family protein n=1 Tax=Rehmannia glutinosa TaxID=99300 RepID=A0ABR0UK98_REHGL
MAKIEVKSSCLVPMVSNANAMTRMDLTPWDLQLLLPDPIQKGILFHKPESEELQNTIIHHLKNSFSRTLDFFPPWPAALAPLRTTITRCVFFVDCNNAGAEFTHAVASDVSVLDILEAKYIPEIVSSFFPLNGIPNYEGISKPLLGVQVTELADGLFIGCTANHAVVDGASFWHFFNSWSEISRGFDKISKTLFLNGDFLIISLSLSPLEQNQLLDFVPPPLLERVFHFSKENVAKLKAKANSEAGSDKISTLQALLAHLWRSVVRCRHLQNINYNLSSQDVQITLIIGARARIPLPEGYFGNAIYVGKIGMSDTEVLQNGLGYAGMKINELVAQQSSEVAIRFVEDWVENPVIMRKSAAGHRIRKHIPVKWVAPIQYVNNKLSKVLVQA